LKTLGRREIEGDTANPGTAGPNGISARIAGSAPEHREQEVLGDGWPFRVSEISAKYVGAALAARISGLKALLQGRKTVVANRSCDVERDFEN